MASTLRFRFTDIKLEMKASASQARVLRNPAKRVSAALVLRDRRDGALWQLARK
jgi:hypothetical protein